MKRKVCVVVTARPSYSRVKTALKAIAAADDLELQLVVAFLGTARSVRQRRGLHRAGRVFHRRTRL
jgi:UDP-N-acetylglucosamine 2-epimerase